MHKELVYGFARSVHERAERIIEQEIFCHDYYMIHDLMNESNEYPTAALLEFSVDQITNYFDTSPASVQEFLDDCPAFDETDNEDLSLEEKLDFAESHGFEPEPAEIYEYWRVSEFLARRLILAKEPVLENNYGSWWGRTCTGQAIIMDGTIQGLLVEREDFS